MAEEVVDSSTLVGNFPAPIEAAVLLVIGEPLSDDHRELILADITKGFQSWDKDATGIDISQELAEISSKADLGEEGSNGERIIRHRSDHVSVEILINPQTSTVQHALKTLLVTETRHKHMIYAGHGFQGTGSWILQDDTFTFGYFAHAFKDSDVENSLRKQEGCTFSIHTFSEGDWSNAHISKLNISKLLHIKLNPNNLLDNASGVMQFTAYVANFVKTTPVTNILQSSDVVGNIRFSRPTLYIFPGCHGDSALFGISGFNLLINGGYSRKACFWDFTRHLDRIDAVLLTHLGTDNLFGISSVLHRKSIQNVHPEIGFLYLNASDKFTHSTVDTVESKQSNLLINLAEEGSRIVEISKQLGQIPHPCSRSNVSQHLEPVNLYHKVGHGSLDMYILNPVTDSKELKDFYQQWNKLVSTFGSQQHVPLPNMLSICALLVWKPADPNDNITRIFFPGNAPQNKVIEGLERIKNLSVLKHLKCCQNDLNKPVSKKVSSLTPRAASAKTTFHQPLSARLDMTRKTDIKVKDEVKSSKSRSTPMTKRDKVAKEDVNKKMAKSTEKTDKQKSSTSSSPSKSSSKSVTPSETPKEVVSPKKESESAVGNLIDVSSVPEPHALDHPLVNHINDDPNCMTESMHEAYPASLATLEDDVKLQSHESPEPLPDPSQFEKTTGDFVQEKLGENHVPFEENMVAIDTHKSEELGIYDGKVLASHETELKSEPLSPGMLHDDEIHPEALPDPVAYPSYIQDPDIIPGTQTNREPSPEQELDTHLEFGNQEPDVVPASQAVVESPSQVDKQVPPEKTKSQFLEDLIRMHDGEDQPTPEEVESCFDHDQIEHSDEALLTEGSEVHQKHVLDYKPVVSPFSLTDELAEHRSVTETNEPHFESVGHQDVDEEQDEKMAFEKHEESDLAAEQMLREPAIETGDLHEVTEHEKSYGDSMQDSMYMPHEENAPLGQNVGEPMSDNQLHSPPCHVEDASQTATVDEEQHLFDKQTAEQEAMADNVYEKSTSESPVNEPNVDPNTYMYEKDVDLSDEESEEDMQNQHIFQQQREDEEETIDNAEHQQVEEIQGDRFEKEEEDCEMELPMKSVGHKIESTEMKPFDDKVTGVWEANPIETEALDRDDEEQEVDNMQKVNVIPREVHETDDVYSDDEPEDEDTVQMGDGIYQFEQLEGPREMEEEQHEVQGHEHCNMPNTGLYGDHGFESHSALHDDHEQSSEQPEVFSIPAAFEKDETPNPADLLATEPRYLGSPVSNTAEILQQTEIGEREDTDSVDSGTPEDEQNIDEAFASMGDPRTGAIMGKDEMHPGPLDMTNDQQDFNPFYGMDHQSEQTASPVDCQQQQCSTNPFADKITEDEEAPIQAPFDPMSNWGKPMGLPSPPPPENSGAAENKSPSKTKKTPIKNGTKPDLKKSDTTKAPSRSKPPEKRPGSLTGNKATNGLADNKPARRPLSAKAEAKPHGRPTSAPTKYLAETKTKTTSRRTTTATGSRSSPSVSKAPPLPPMTPFYVDLTYIPNHGNPSYTDIEFFKRIRARFYVLSSLSPNPQVLNALLDAKQTWEDKEIEVTVIPTYDNDIMRHWVALHKDRLSELKVDIAPSANRCTIQLQDHETSCSAYRLEF